MSGLLNELKRRRVFRTAAVYVALCWAILQLFDVFQPILKFPEWLLTALVLVSIAGFPLVLLGAWLFDLTRHGLVADGGAQSNKRSARMLEIGAISVLALLIGGVYFTQDFDEIASEASLEVATAQGDALPTQQVSQQPQPLNSPTAPFLPSQSDKISVAVLPFVNFSGNKENEYFADGLTEELLNVLASVRQLRVAARTSSFEYKNSNIDIRRIAEQLGVTYLLEGSVRRSGDTIRITAQLIDGRDGSHLWSHTWDKPFQDLFLIQDQIADAVLGELKVSLLKEDEQYLAKRGTDDLEAFAEYSRGLTELHKRTEKGFEQAREHFEQAAEQDPEYAEAYAGLANVELLATSYGYVPLEQSHKLARQHIAKALSLNEQLPTAYGARALMLWQSPKGERAENLDRALDNLLKAIDLNPSYAEAYMWYGSILQTKGEYLKGEAYHKRAYELDPQSRVASFNRAMDLLRRNDFEGAMTVFNNIVRHHPNYAGAYQIAGEVSYRAGALDQAYQLFERSAQLEGKFADIWPQNAARILTNLGDYDGARDMLDKITKTKESKPAWRFELEAAWAVAQGKTERLDELEQQYLKGEDDLYSFAMRGMKALVQQRWRDVVAHYQQAIDMQETLGESWMEEFWLLRAEIALAEAYSQLDQPLEAEQWLTRVEEQLQQIKQVGMLSARHRYLEALVKTMRGDTARAVQLLSQAIQEGWTERWWLNVDSAMHTLKNEPGFQAAMSGLNTELALMKRNISRQNQQKYAELSQRSSY